MLLVAVTSSLLQTGSTPGVCLCYMFSPGPGPGHARLVLTHVFMCWSVLQCVWVAFGTVG